MNKKVRCRQPSLGRLHTGGVSTILTRPPHPTPTLCTSMGWAHIWVAHLPTLRAQARCANREDRDGSIWSGHPHSPEVFRWKDRVREDNLVRGCPHRQGVKRPHICMRPKPNFPGHGRCPSRVSMWTRGGGHSRGPRAGRIVRVLGAGNHNSHVLNKRTALEEANSSYRLWGLKGVLNPKDASERLASCAGIPACSPGSPCLLPRRGKPHGHAPTVHQPQRRGASAKNSPALTSGPRKLQPAPPQMATASFLGEAAGSSRPAALWSVPEDTRLVEGRGMGSAGAPPGPPTPVPIQEAGQWAQLCPHPAVPSVAHSIPCRRIHRDLGAGGYFPAKERWPVRHGTGSGCLWGAKGLCVYRDMDMCPPFTVFSGAEIATWPYWWLRGSPTVTTRKWEKFRAVPQKQKHRQC